MARPMEECRDSGPCPTCGGIRPARILYGYHFWTDGLKDAIDQGEIALGGCVIGEDNREWQCNKCGCRWGSRHQ